MGEDNASCHFSHTDQTALARSGSRGLFIQVSVMTSDDKLSLILRRLDEIERKLDRMMEELRPTAIGYSARRGNRPRKD
jgi:hypothetical protein